MKRQILRLWFQRFTDLRFQFHKVKRPAWTNSTMFRLGVVAATGGSLMGIFSWNSLGEHSSLPSIRASAELALPSTGLCAGEFRSDLPSFRLADIKKHTVSNGGSVWVTYKTGVYDITEFIEAHPGGPEEIIAAAGGSIEPFWKFYAQHNTTDVKEILEELRIGNVSLEDQIENVKTEAVDVFANEPARHPALIVNSHKPFDSEPPPDVLVDSFITPNEFFFVRNHLPVPRVDADTHTVTLNYGGKEDKVFSLKDLENRFSTHSVVTTIQCAGNRRTEMGRDKRVVGLGCAQGQISTAKWTGVRLCDVLKECGVTEKSVKDAGFKHVHFWGLDQDMLGSRYGASIPLEMALDESREVLLASQMNDEPLPPDHGFPLRIIIPGVVGARQVKWLSHITLSAEECPSHWQQSDYKMFNPDIDVSTADWKYELVHAIQDAPVQSAICSPLDNSKLEQRANMTIKGYAWSGGGRGINRVDVSIDGGLTWLPTKLVSLAQPFGQKWGWTLWEVVIEIPKSYKGKSVEIICKAQDSSHNVQPRDVGEIWNFRGLLNNSWHRINVELPLE